jgi:hypothetical protein
MKGRSDHSNLTRKNCLFLYHEPNVDQEPPVVGQMSDLIQEFPGKTFNEWKAWYGKRKSFAIDDATDRIWSMILNLKKAIQLVERNLVKDWVFDLVANKTFTGMKFQLSISKRIAAVKSKPRELTAVLVRYQYQISLSLIRPNPVLARESMPASPSTKRK